MSEIFQSANLSPEKHTDIFASRLADKTTGQCSKECCSVQRRLEMKFSHCSTQTWRHGTKAATSCLVFYHFQLADLSQKVTFCETSPLNLNSYSKSSTIKKRSLQSMKSSR